MRKCLIASGFLVALCLSGSTRAAEEKQAYSVVVGGLDNPSGIVVQQGTGHLLVADHQGVHRVNPKAEGKASVTPEINGYPTDIYGKGPKYEIGPLGLAWLNKDHLVVGDGSRPDGSEFLRIYKIGTEPLEEPIKESNAVVTLGPIKAGEKSVMGEGNFYGVAVGNNSIFITCNGDDTKGWVSKTTYEGGKYTELTPTIATKVATGVDAPVGITFSPDGKQLVISQMGEMNVKNDSLITFYNPETGELTAKHETKLHDISGVAYSPKTKKLYVTDYAWAATEEGGLFELTVGTDGVNTKKIASLDRPSALSFDPDGNLYVTVFGHGEDKKGAVLRFAADSLK